MAKIERRNRGRVVSAVATLLVLSSPAMTGCKKAEGQYNGCECTRDLDCSSKYCYEGVCMQVDAYRRFIRFQCTTHGDCGCGAYCISFAYNYASLTYNSGCLVTGQTVRHGYICVVPCNVTDDCPKGMLCAMDDATPKTGSNGQTCSEVGISHDYGSLSKDQHKKLWEAVKTPGYCVWQ